MCEIEILTFSDPFNLTELGENIEIDIGLYSTELYEIFKHNIVPLILGSIPIRIIPSHLIHFVKQSRPCLVAVFVRFGIFRKLVSIIWSKRLDVINMSFVE
jgi:hypothetical protein